MTMFRVGILSIYCWTILSQPYAANAFVAPQKGTTPCLTALCAAARDNEGEAKKNRPETSLQMSDATMEATGTEEDLVQKADSFQAIVDGIKELKAAQGGTSPAAFSEEDMRLLRKLLQGDIKSKFEEDAYWEKVRRPVDEATTINPEVFRSQEFFDLEHKKILEKSWVCVATSDQVRNEGDVIATMAAGKPIIVSRAKDGELRAFYNVCRHRGARLMSEEDNGKKVCISCPYHNWGYGLDGKLLATPNWNTNADGHKHSKKGTMMANSGMVKNFSKEESGLYPVRVQQWGPFIYVNLSGDAVPLEEYLGRVVPDLEAFPFDDLVTVKEDKFEVNANWKLLAENYIDFYHLSTVHPDYAQVSVPEDHIRAQGEGMYAGYVTYPLTNADTPLDLDRFPLMKGLEGTKHEVTGWYQIHFPNMFFFLLPHSLFMVMLEPTSVGRSVEHCRLLVHKDGLAEMGDKAEKAIQDMWDYYYTVNTEDFEVCEKTQVGIKADTFTGGRMVFAYEESLNRYHNMIANCMTDDHDKIPEGDEEPSFFDKIPVYGYKKEEHSTDAEE